MFILAPSLILLFTALTVIVLHRFKPQFNGAWLVAVMGAFISWITLLVLRFRLPTSLVILAWDKTGMALSPPMLIIDYNTWPFAFAIGSLILAIMLSSPVNLRSRSEILNLAGNLAIAGISYTAFLAANVETLLLGWAAIDLVELTVLMRTNPAVSSHRRILTGFISRFSGLLIMNWLVFMGTDRALAGQQVTRFTSWTALPVALALVLRLGLFPVHITYGENSRIRRSQGNLFRFIPPASAMVYLTTLPVESFGGLLIPLQWVLIIALGYGVYKWLMIPGDLDARPYWVLCLAALGFLSSLHSSHYALIPWSAALILVGGIIYLHDTATPFIRGIQYAAIVLLSGLPFTPNASGLAGLMAAPSLAIELICLILFLLVLFGLFKRIRQKPLLASGQEQIIYLTYPLSMLLLLLSYLMIGLFGWPGSRTIGPWKAVIVASVLVIAVLVLIRWRTRWFNGLLERIKAVDWMALRVVYRKVVKFITALPVKVLQVLGATLQAGVRWVSVLLEGSNSLLWGLIILMLLVMLIGSGG